MTVRPTTTHPPEAGDRQGSREARARKLLADGAITFTQTEAGAFDCQENGFKKYSVTLESCTCPDFTIWGKHGLRCKHLCALQIWLQAAEPPPPAPPPLVQATTRSAAPPGAADTTPAPAPRTPLAGHFNPTFHFQAKGETPMDQPNNSSLTGWVKLYHPSAGGVLCTLPLLLTAPLTAEQAQALFESVDRLIEAGFRTTQPGLEEGETRETVTHLARRSKSNPDGRSTPVLDVYCGGSFKTIHLYLNTDDDIAEFAQAFGITLASIPLFEGDAAIERNKNADRDKKYVIPVSGVDVVYRLNPKWEGDEDKKHAKRLFVRWERSGSRKPETPAAQPAAAPANGNGHKARSAEQALSDLGFATEPAAVKKAGDLVVTVGKSAGKKVRELNSSALLYFAGEEVDGQHFSPTDAPQLALQAAARTFLDWQLQHTVQPA